MNVECFQKFVKVVERNENFRLEQRGFEELEDLVWALEF